MGKRSRKQGEELEAKETDGSESMASGESALAKWEPQPHFLTVSPVKASGSSLSPTFLMCQTGGGRGLDLGGLWDLSLFARFCDEEGDRPQQHCSVLKSKGTASSSLSLRKSRLCRPRLEPVGLPSRGPSCDGLIGRGVCFCSPQAPPVPRLSPAQNCPNSK